MNDNFIHGVTTEKKPWTHLNFGDRGGMDFSFGIISDRTGRATPGVFEGAIEKFNRMRPDFVISVGDFIEGGCMEDFSAPFLQKVLCHNQAHRYKCFRWPDLRAILAHSRLY